MKINVNGYEIAYQITGEGEDTVVILQGWGTELATYNSVAACISDRYRVVQFDFPGFGASDEPREPWAVEDYAKFFLDFMAALGIQKATLIGHSYGGRVIIRLAARESLPFTIERIVLIDSAGILPKKTWKQKIKIRRYKVLKKIVNLKLVYAICPMMRQCLVKAVNEDLTELLPRIRQDTLLIWGDLDTATPIADAKLMEEKIPGAGLAVIPGTGHFSFLENPALFRNIMHAYFA